MRKEITAATQHKDTLIGMILRPKDLRTAREQGWYRIPVKSAPEVVTSGALNTLALYQTKAFDEEKYSVRWWGDVIDIDKKKRIALLPEEPADRNAQEWYYVVKVQAFKQLVAPIISPIPRRNAFITTTRDRLFRAKNFNDLFCGSPLEERLWDALHQEGIPVQRDFMVSRTVGKKKTTYYLDFAMFCKEVNIAIECDGKTHHNSEEAVEYDKDRDVKVQNMRFTVYRFTTDKIMNHLPETVQHIKQAVKQYGGVVDALNPAKTLYMPRPQDLPGQEMMFG